MEKKELLNEEEYQKNNKKVKTAGIIVLLLGVFIIVAGIICVISANFMEVPPMGDANWFDASSAQMGRNSLGMFLIIPGIFVTAVGCMIRFGIGNQREIMAYHLQQTMPLAQEGIEKMTPTMVETGKTIAKEMAPVYGEVAKEVAHGIKEGMGNESKKCQYCGTVLDGDSKFCKNCGKGL